MTVPALRLVGTPTPGPDLDAGWQVHAACAGMNGDLFFPGQGESVKEAKAVCVTCPVASECLEYSFENNEHFGIWGGLTERERIKIRRANTGPASGPKILSLLRASGPLTSAQVARRLNMSHDASTAAMRRLHESGQLARTGRTNRAWLYQIPGGGK